MTPQPSDEAMRRLREAVDRLDLSVLALNGATGLDYAHKRACVDVAQQDVVSAAREWRMRTAEYDAAAPAVVEESK